MFYVQFKSCFVAYYRKGVFAAGIFLFLGGGLGDFMTPFAIIRSTQKEQATKVSAFLLKRKHRLSSRANKQNNTIAKISVMVSKISVMVFYG